MNDEYLLKKGYKQYNPTDYDDKYIVTRFQKRFDNKYGKKYFINILKWSYDFIPREHRDEHWQSYGYEYEVQVSMYKEGNIIDLYFHTDWDLDKVEKFMEDFFNKMQPNYYELWDERRSVRPNAEN